MVRENKEVLRPWGGGAQAVKLKLGRSFEREDGGAPIWLCL